VAGPARLRDVRGRGGDDRFAAAGAGNAHRQPGQEADLDVRRHDHLDDHVPAPHHRHGRDDGALGFGAGARGRAVPHAAGHPPAVARAAADLVPVRQADARSPLRLLARRHRRALRPPGGQGMSTATTATPAYDKQGEQTDQARLDAAMSSFAREFSVTAALHMESCVRCGLCAEACHFYVTTGDPKYTPVYKLEPFRRAYFREASPLAPLMRALGLMKKPTIDD